MKKDIQKSKNGQLRSQLANKRTLGLKKLKETIKLNAYGQVFIILSYTLVIVAGAKVYFSSNISNKLIGELSDIRAQQEQILSNIQNSDQRAIPREVITSELETRIIKNLQNEFKHSNTYTQKVIEQQKFEIHKLKNRLEKALLLSYRSPASVAEKEITMTYSKKNLDIMYFKHRQELKRLKSDNQDKEEAFLSLYDLSNKAQREEYKNLKDNNELNYYKLERELREKRSRFKKYKYIALK